MAIWAQVLWAWGWSCKGQAGGGSSPPPKWVRADSTVLTYSLQLTVLIHSPTLFLSVSLWLNFFLLLPYDSSLPLSSSCMHNNLSVHMYLNIHVGGVSIIKIYLTLFAQQAHFAIFPFALLIKKFTHFFFPESFDSVRLCPSFATFNYMWPSAGMTEYTTGWFPSVMYYIYTGSHVERLHRVVDFNLSSCYIHKYNSIFYEVNK